MKHRIAWIPYFDYPGEDGGPLDSAYINENKKMALEDAKDDYAIGTKFKVIPVYYDDDDLLKRTAKAASV